MTSPNDVQRLEAEVRLLEATLREEREATRQSRRFTLTFCGVLVTLVLAFALVNYFKLSSELTAENFRKSLEHELREVGPVAMEEFSRLGENLLPVFAAEWKKQMEAAWPEIQKQLEAEVSQLGSGASNRVNSLLADAQERIFARVEASIEETYPQLNSPESRVQLDRRLHQVCDATLHEALLTFDKSFSKDVGALQRTVLKFDVSDTNESTVDLQKKFLRLWLQLLDQEIMKL